MKRIAAGLALVLGGVAAWQAISAFGRPGEFEVGLDLRIIVWAPVHGLFAGFDPYAPTGTYLSTYGVDVPATLHAPSVLLLTGLAALGSLATAYALVTVVSVAALWASALIVVPPRTRGTAAAAVALGCLLTFSGAGEAVLLLGQVTALAVLGLALVVRWPSSWVAAVGVALLCTSPQFAVPLSILLLGLGVRRAVVAGWTLAVLASLPVLVWAGVNAGGAGPLMASLGESLRSSDAHDNTTNRIDLAGAYAGGDVRMLLVLLVLTVVGAVWLHLRSVRLTPTTALVATAWSLLATYSMPYSLVLLLLLAVPALMARPWGVVEWSALAVVTGSALLALPLSTRVAHLLGAGTGQVWAVASALLGLLLGVLVVAGLLRVRGAPDAAALAVRPA